MDSASGKNDAEIDIVIRKGLLLANLPAGGQALDFDYSPQYKRWERGLLKNPQRFIKKNSRTAFRRALDVAAAVFITLAVLFGALIASSPGARAAVIRWFRERFPTHDTYRFTQTSDAQELGQWRPTYLPDGYVETLCMDLGNQIIVNFENEEGERITLNFLFINEGKLFYIDNEDMDIAETKIGGHAAQVYKAQDNSKKNNIVWIDEGSGVAFNLTSFEPCEVLISMAESMELYG